MALLAGAYGWAPDVLRNLTDAEAAYYLLHMREVQLRHAYPMAQLEARALNMMGGKRPPKNPSDEPPLADHERFTAFELLPWYARPEWVQEDASGSISQAAARDFLANVKRLPSWALEIAPVNAIRHAARA